ncbi:hypothetical protein D3C73_1419220 [compost metagenome]
MVERTIEQRSRAFNGMNDVQKRNLFLPALQPVAAVRTGCGLDEIRLDQLGQDLRQIRRRYPLPFREQLYTYWLVRCSRHQIEHCVQRIVGCL